MKQKPIAAKVAIELAETLTSEAQAKGLSLNGYLVEILKNRHYTGDSTAPIFVDDPRPVAELAEAKTHLQAVADWCLSVYRTLEKAPAIIFLPKFPEATREYLKTL
jgi:hypothetical protein